MNERTEQRSETVLVCVGGLPATGKTTIARELASQLRAPYIRVDTIETVIAQAEGRFEESNRWEQPPGYAAGYALAADQLRVGLDVVAESVNPLRASRDAWRDAGRSAQAKVVEVEVVCSDIEEHRRRAEERVLDIPGLDKPNWHQIRNREYEPWDRDRLVIDTATMSADQSAQRVLQAIRR